MLGFLQPTTCKSVVIVAKAAVGIVRMDFTNQHAKGKKCEWKTPRMFAAIRASEKKGRPIWSVSLRDTAEEPRCPRSTICRVWHYNRNRAFPAFREMRIDRILSHGD